MSDEIILSDGSRLETGGKRDTVYIVPSGKRVAVRMEDVQMIGFLLVLLDFWETHDAEKRLRWFEHLFETLRETAEMSNE